MSHDVMSPLSAPARVHPRVWVLGVVRVTLLLTVLVLGVCSVVSIWTGPFTGSYLWLVLGLPQMSIALLAVVLCWDRDSRPPGLWFITVMLTMYGLIFAVVSAVWPLVAMGALILVAIFVSPREWIFSGPPPPRFVWVRDHLLGQDCDPEPRRRRDPGRHRPRCAPAGRDGRWLPPGAGFRPDGGVLVPEMGHVRLRVVHRARVLARPGMGSLGGPRRHACRLRGADGRDRFPVSQPEADPGNQLTGAGVESDG
jgi:hypothetical protein